MSLSFTASADEFQINQFTTGDQIAPEVISTTDGGFLVVWQSPVTPGDDTNLAILGRRLDDLGTPTSDDFQVNVSTNYSQRRPRLSRRGDSSFIVVWETFYPGGKGLLHALQARPFDASGLGSPSDFTVAVAPNIYTTIVSHDVGAADDNEFVVVFSRFYYGPSSNYHGDAVARRWQSDGTQIDQTTLVGQNSREVTVRLAGDDSLGFVVATTAREYFGQYSDVEAVRLDTSGVGVGGSWAVHPGIAFGGSTAADVALAPTGEFVVSWNGYDTYNGTGTEVYGRHVNAADVLDPAGPHQLNAFTTGFEFSPRLARGADGTFLAVWEKSNPPDDDANGLRARWLDSSGVPLGDEFAVNEYTTGSQRAPEVAASADGTQFLVVWYGDGDGSGAGIRGRRFGLPGLVFLDGFESGDLSAWSSSTP